MQWHDVVYEVWYSNGDDGFSKGWFYRVFQVVETDAKGTKKLDAADPIGPFDTDEDAMNHFDARIANGDAGRHVRTMKKGLWSRLVYPKGTGCPGDLRKTGDEDENQN